MRTTKLLILLCALIVTNVMTKAQNKPLTLEDLIPGGKTYSQMTPAGINAKWYGNMLLRLDKNQCAAYDLKAVAKASAGNKSATICSDPKQLPLGKPLFSRKQINDALRASSLDTLQTLGTLTFPYTDKPLAMAMVSGKRVLINWETGKVEWTQTRPNNTAEDWSSTSRNLAFVKDDNLFVQTAADQVLQVSTDGSRQLVYGQSVHRNELGINKGTFWSPDGSRLAYYRMDQSMVTDYPQVDISQRIAAHTPDKYPMAGETSHVVSVGVFDVAQAKTTWLQLGEQVDHYFSGISWSPDSKTVYVIITNRDQNHDELWAFNAETGAKMQKIYEESNPKYVHPEYHPIFLPWDDSQFVYQTENNGFSHLYLFSKDGKQQRDLTPGDYVVTSVVGFNPKTKSVIVCTTRQHDLQHNLFAIDVATGRQTLLDNGQGYHNATLNPDGSMILDRWSSPDVKLQYDVLLTSRQSITPLYKPNDPWRNYAVPNIQGGTLKAADGVTDLYYRLITPPDFDPTRKYPAVVYLYGGPHSRLVTAQWGYGYRGWELYMASQGYVVFVMDNRGSSERGLAFENVTYRHLGEEEMKDQLRGVELLKSLPYVDAERLGVHGWSFGGFMTTNLMLSYPDVFKVAVAGGPVIDWKYYEVMYGERYMSTPQKNPDGYKGSNLNLKAGNLKGRLMIIFGYNDPVCVPQHTLSFMRACADAGTHPDLFTYPGAGHNMSGRDRVHLHEHITRYFNDFLQ